MSEGLQALLSIVVSLMPIIGAAILFKQSQQNELVKQLRADLDEARKQIEELKSDLAAAQIELHQRNRNYTPTRR